LLENKGEHAVGVLVDGGIVLLGCHAK
jgi:hypothetical protein